MPAYSFEAMQHDGKVRRGVIEADTAKAARSLLRSQALVPLDVNPVSAAAPGSARSVLQTPLFAGRVFNATRLAIWTRQLAGLVAAGLPLERALTALSDEAEDERQRNLVAALRAEVNGGTSFARAMSQHPHEFSDIYIAVIGAGEQSGHLGLVLERLADDLEESQTLKSKLVGAALYPAIVTLVAIVIVMFLVGYVVPQVANVFAGTKRALPFLTVAMLSISGFVRNYGWAVLAALVAAAFAVRLALRQDSFRERFDATTLRLPLVGRLARDYNAARFASTLAMLAGAGVPILKALQAAAETLSNRAMRADALDALLLVREGAPLASAMAQKKRFPGLVSMFARLGEQTGQLPVMLQRAARQLSTEVQRRAMALATILEPLLIVAMGLVVMLIVLAVLLPIIQLNQFVK
ncbi:MAG: type II secretion system protein GspF [Polaromonas sp. 39-63-203]|jgi:general secretion pathway protein F|uniref:type II secretion system inner membrane protein GspF n=1 Tax=Polaromonas sp. TaxID=1869339 RepID=UPI000BD4C26F|nr:type II secretion system inner membrane protein GspF [Polaromonas sp.]OYY51043.1 MAG: type II secretion system protein GspF [Polaromonas sp. 35-63-240]OYY92498.1 MAG: type II secretion system protein GspF [Polaromonas sp. 28-63-22]OYZ81719.1 MAG: type II secretion system protein GspF [Polaromonas sp. 24-62-144]OZA95551.1 MAG: type II secretion system protein GspF [Polaromonas sp. 39-63-203]HQS33027.1 type II secretion system inner membrane protein GspF [Polaromonas sp.]